MAELDVRTAATSAVAIDVQVGKLLAEREATVIAIATNMYNAFKLTPEMALAYWGQMAELGRIDSLLENKARKSIRAAEQAEVDGDE